MQRSLCVMATVNSVRVQRAGGDASHLKTQRKWWSYDQSTGLDKIASFTSECTSSFAKAK